MKNIFMFFVFMGSIITMTTLFSDAWIWEQDGNCNQTIIVKHIKNCEG